jgi:hypothetical protein
MKRITLTTLDKVRADVALWVKDHVVTISAETLGWMAAMFIHFSIIPTLLAAMAGLTDKMPPVDMVLFCWGALALLFVKAVMLRDRLNTLTIGLGFIIQCTLMGLMLFK